MNNSEVVSSASSAQATRIPTSETPNGPICFPGTYDPDSPWRFYNRLIAEIPDDIDVIDYEFGEHWSYVEADCGMGIAFTCRGGTARTYAGDLRGLPLKSVAELSKSWCFEEATLGVAALNAYYMQRGLLDSLGVVYDPIESSNTASIPPGAFTSPGASDAQPEQPIEPNIDSSSAAFREIRSSASRDAFDLYRPRIEAQKDAHVVVVGHFPNVDRIAEYAHLTVLERNCRSDIDTPDPACEYVLPQADYAFITGVTVINKTAPRLLELAKNAHTIMVGPSVIVTPILFEWGVETLGSRVVIDPEKTRYAIKNSEPFGEAVRMCTYTNPAFENR